MPSVQTGVGNENAPVDTEADERCTAQADSEEERYVNHEQSVTIRRISLATEAKTNLYEAMRFVKRDIVENGTVSEENESVTDLTEAVQQHDRSQAISFEGEIDGTRNDTAASHNTNTSMTPNVTTNNTQQLTQPLTISTGQNADEAFVNEVDGVSPLSICGEVQDVNEEADAWKHYHTCATVDKKLDFEVSTELEEEKAVVKVLPDNGRTADSIEDENDNGNVLSIYDFTDSDSDASSINSYFVPVRETLVPISKNFIDFTHNIP